MADEMKDSIKQGVQRVVQKLYDERKSVRPSDLVEAAKPKTSPAHNAFTWDNAKAAHQFRLVEARNWIRVVVVKPSEDEAAERLVHVPIVVQAQDSAREGEYKPVSVVAESPDEYMRARSEVLHKGRALAAALAELDEAAAKRGKTDMSAVIAQISRGLDLFERAIETMH